MGDQKTFISKGAFFEGDIYAEQIIVAGRVVGNLSAQSVVTIQEEGWVKGNIQAPKIFMADGCFHEGMLRLQKPEKDTPTELDVDNIKSTTKKAPNISKDTKEKKVPDKSKKAKSKLW